MSPNSQGMFAKIVILVADYWIIGKFFNVLKNKTENAFSPLPARTKPRCSPANKATGLRPDNFAPPRCSGSFSNCIQALCSHLQWQDTKLHARGGCCPAAVAGYQTAIPNCMHAVAFALLQWQDTKVPLAVTGYQTACTRRLLPCCSSRIPNCMRAWLPCCSVRLSNCFIE
jgi:hypothetical protein